ncbi:hypothetical protein Tco_0024001 [Tanacetum coccineum]
MCRQPLPPPLSSPSAKLMIMALEEYGYQSRRGIRVRWEMEDVRQLAVMWECEFTLSSLVVLQGFSFFLQMGFTLILATLDGLDVGLLGDVIGEDDCDDDG